MISCPNCGGNLKFDIPTQNLSCEFCHETFDPYAFDSKTSDAQETKSVEGGFEVTIFTCPQCGGEILSTDNAATGFCSFCGASTILYSRISHERRPKYIIPFQKTKEDCKQSYMNLMRHAIFAPKELKNAKYIDGFRGIYMPYWAYYITQKGDFSLQGYKEYRKGNYIYKDYYNLNGQIDSYYKGLSYDASSSFADNISEALAPYDVKQMKAFTPGYLSGFYADTADVAPSVYQDDAEATAFDHSIKELTHAKGFASYTLENTPTDKKILHTKTETVDSTMFPVWFMSYRKNDRIAYVTVNGQTGKIVADVPIDPKKYLLGSILLAIPIFILLAAFFTMIPSSLLVCCGALALFTAILYTFELSAIAKKDSLYGDRGLLYKQSPEQASRHPDKQSNPLAGCGKRLLALTRLGNLFYILFLVGFGVQIVYSIIHASAVSSGIPWILIMVGMLVTVCIGISKLKKFSSHVTVPGYISSSVAVLIGAVIAFLKPVSDFYYYIGAVIVLIAVIVAITDIIRYHNVLSTHKLPQFDRKGGDDRA